ncbi:MAG: sulfotransferase [Nitrospirota bacterium]
MKSYIYLTSFGYSGSTLLSFLLDSHSEIASVGELNGPIPGMDMDTYQCSCGVRLMDCHFWLDVQKQMAERDLPLEFHNFKTSYYFHDLTRFMDKALLYTFNSRFLNCLKDMFFRLNRSRIAYINEINNRCVAMAEIITELKGSEHFFDASKSSNMLKYLPKVRNINFKVIFLIRDARSLICSYMTRYPQIAIHEAANIWLKSTNQREAILKSYISPDRLIRIRYEDLCQETEATLKQIYNFIGVEDYPLSLPIKAEDHHILGNKMRLGIIQEIRLDEKWKTRFNDKQRAIIETIAGRQNSIYGYN